MISGTDTELLSVGTKVVSLSDQGHSMVTHGQFSFVTATPMPHASGRSPRGGDRHGPNHTSSRALCVELSELTSRTSIGDGSQSGMGRATSKGPETAVNEVVQIPYKRRSSSKKPMLGTREKCELVKNLHTFERSFLELIAAAAAIT